MDWDKSNTEVSEVKNLSLLMTVIVLVLFLVVVTVGCQSQAPAVPVQTPTATPVQDRTPTPTVLTSAPEFRVSSLIIAPKETVTGESVIVKASVENIGKSGGTYRASLTVNGKVVETKDTPLAAGARQDIAFKITAVTPGTNTIKLGELVETLRILKPAKFRVTRLDISPRLIKTGENVTVNISLINEGEANGTHSLSLILDGKVVATKDVALGGGATQPVYFTVGQNLPGIHNIEIGDLKGIVRVIDYMRPPTGTYFVGKQDRNLEATDLLVKNESDLDAVVILTKSLAPKTPRKAVYIKSNDTHKLYVIETNDLYYVYYALGKNWDNYMKEFATDRECMWFPEKFNFGKYYITIRLVKGAQFKFKDIESCNEEEFPKLQ